MTTLTGGIAVPTSVGRSAVRVRVAPAVVVGLVGTLFVWLGSWQPSFWGDEAASVMSAERSIPSLFGMLTRVDAVHGLYYLFLHFWIDLFGASEASVRLPSAIAVGIAAAGVVTLASRFGTRTFAVLAGVVFLLLPRVDLAGVEARSYAMGTAVAVWLTVLFLANLRRPTHRIIPWVVYGIAAGLSAYLFLYLIFIVLVHGIIAAATAEGRARVRGVLLGAGIAIIVSAPMGVIAVHEKAQLRFLSTRSYANANSVFISQWFGWLPLAILGWALIACAVTAAVLHARRPRLGEALPLSRTGLLLALAWLVIPTTVLLLGNAFVSPMYNIRYVTYSAPAVAVLVTAGAASVPLLLDRMRTAMADRRRRGGLISPAPRRLRSGTITIEVLALVTLLALPAFIVQRGPYAKDDGSDLRQVAETVAAVSAPGDAIVFDQAVRPSRRPRLALHLYPQDFAGLTDVGLKTPYAQRRGIWDTVTPVAGLASQLASVDRVLAVEMSGSGAVPPDIAALRSQGFEISEVHHVHRTDVYTLTKEKS